MATKARKHWSIGPSSLSYDYPECPLCWRRYVTGDPLKRPYSPMPGIFNRIDGAMKKFFHGEDTKRISDTLPQGLIASNSEALMQSAPLGTYQGLPIFLRGKLDALAFYDNGAVGVVDFKTALPGDSTRYLHQLMSYVYLLEHPDEAKPTHQYRKVETIGIHAFTPTDVVEDIISGKVSIVGELEYVPMDLTEDSRNAFLEFIVTDVCDTVKNKDVAPGEGCATCARDALVAEAALTAYHNRHQVDLSDDFTE